MQLTAHWWFWALLAALAAALTAVFAKIGLEGVDSDFATLIRTLMVVALLALIVFATGKWTNPLALAPRTWLFLALSALGTGASWLFYFRALQMGQAYQVAPVDKLSVVLVALLAVVFLGERPAPRDWAGIGLVTAGVALLVFKR
ncbi:EamA family transporter [Thiomonas sp.]|jgi:transporter family protein|uniref:EamA family transporter n=1 Tax=Thiomonas sp. TaxID=2047785 RepID=UPI002610FDDD|nr:EamA family transporter [Thiomonas sp.]